MFSRTFVRASGNGGLRRRMRQQRNDERRLALQNRWYVGGIAAVVSTALVFSGLSPASAEEVQPDPAATTQAADTPTDTATDPPATDTTATDTSATDPSSTDAAATEPPQTPAESATDTPAAADGTSDAPMQAFAAPDAGISIQALLACTAWPAAGSPVAGFEIDGNLCLNGAGTKDWATVGGQPVRDDTFDDIHQFDQGASEASWPWSANQTVLNSGSGSSKTDIGNVYAYTQTVGGHVYAYLGFERETNEGSVSYHVELNQKPNVAPDSPVTVRTVGDLRLTIQQDGNNPPQLVGAHTWNGTKWVALPNLSGFVGQVNQGPINDLTTRELETGTFAEAAVDLTALFGEGNCSGNFGVLNVRSSQSPSETSSLADWIDPVALSIPSTCATLTILKTGLNGTPLAGAKFTVSPDPATGVAGSSVTGITTGADGKFVFNGTVHPGTYTVTETQAPQGYLLPTSDNPQQVTLGNSESKTVTFSDPLGTATWLKQDPDGNPVGGATFQVVATAGGVATGVPAFPRTVVDNGVNDVDPAPGVIKIVNVPIGSYTVTETAAPADYVLDTTSRAFTIAQGSSDASVATPFVNIPYATVTLTKHWVNSFAGDTANLSIAGAATANGTSTAPTDGPVLTVKVAPGSALNLAEALGQNNRGLYGSTLSCGPVNVAGNVGTAGSITVPQYPASKAGVACTFTNTAKTRTVTLQKEWVDAFQGDSAVLALTGDADGATSTATGAAGSQLDTTHVATATVRVGETVDFGEQLNAPSGGQYGTTFSCTPGSVTPTPNSTVSFTLDRMPDTDVTCTFTNETAKATVILKKAWVNAFEGDIAKLSITGAKSSAADAIAPEGNGTSAEFAQVVVRVGDKLTLSESLPGANTGEYTASWDCTHDQVITVTGDMTCTVTNTAKTVHVRVDKVWKDAFQGDTADLSVNDTTNTATADGSADQTITGVVDEVVRVGDDVTVEEVLGDNTGTYNTTFSCTVVDEQKSGLTASFTAPDTDVVCTYTNEAVKHLVTLQKKWVDAFEGDKTTLKAGALTALSTANGDSGAWIDAAHQVKVWVRDGDSIALSETAVTGTGTYATTYSCNGGVETSGMSFTLAVSGADVLCTFTNTAQKAVVKLQKDWQNAFVGDTAGLLIGAPGPDGTATSTATATNGVDAQHIASVTVRLGDEVNLSETLPAAGTNTGSYSTTWVCDDNTSGGGIVIGALTVTAPVTCTITNTAKQIDVHVNKVWKDAFQGDTAELSANGLTGTATADGSATQTLTDVVVKTVRVGEGVTVKEVLGDNTGTYDTTATCTGVTETLSDANRTATFTAPAGDVSCTFTNEARTHTVTLQKAWNDAIVGDTAGLTIAAAPGGKIYGGTPTNTSTATSATFTDTGHTATTQVRVGDTVDLSEVVSGTGSYSSSYDCNDTADTKGSGQQFALAMPDENVTCTFTNTAGRATVTLKKNWIGAFAGDEAHLSITGAASDSDTSIASGADGVDDTFSQVSVRLGEKVTLAESIVDADNQGRYDASWSCDDETNGEGRSIGELTVTGDIVCTITNTAKRIDVTINKQWQNAFIGDEATMMIGADGAVSSAGTPNQLDEDVLTRTVRVGETVDMSEAIDDGANTGRYGSSYVCDGVDVSGDGRELSFTAPGADVSCTFTNTALKVGVLLGKQWIGALPGDGTELSIQPEDGPLATAQSLIALGGARTDNGLIAVQVRIGATLPMAERMLDGVKGVYASTFHCSGGETTAVAGSEGRAFTLKVTGSSAIACLFVNESQTATVHLIKSWVNGQDGDTADLSISGQTSDTATSTADGTVGTFTDLVNEATAEGLIGSQVSVSEVVEVLKGAASDYTSSLRCVAGDEEVVIAQDGREGSFTMPAEPVWCTFTNEAALPTLALVKTVSPAVADDTNWKLTGAPAGEGAPTVTDAGGDVPPVQVPTDVAYDLSEQVVGQVPGLGEFEAGLWSCVSDKAGTITLTDPAAGVASLRGLDKGENVVCTIVNSHVDQGFTIDKTTKSSEQNEDGTWTVTYDVTVHNNSVLVPITYDLTDTLDAPPAGVTYLGATWTGPTSGSFATGALSAQLADGETLAPYAVDNDAVYTVAVVVKVDAIPAEHDVCDEGGDGIGIVNTAEVTVGEESEDAEACGTVHFDDVDVVKTASDLPEQGSVEPGDEFSYTLTVTNNGTRDAEDVVVTDAVPERLEVTGIDLPDGWVNDNGSDLVGEGNELSVSVPVLAEGESVDIVVHVTFLPTTVPPVEPGDESSQPADPLESLTNTACVAAERDQVEENNCSTVEIPVREITAIVWTKCVADAPFLGWTISKSQELIDEDIHFVWTPDTGTATTDPASVDITQPGGTATWSDEIAWPGAAFTPSGVSIDYPGWRPIELADIVPGSSPTQYYYPGTTDIIPAEDQANYIFNGLILDDSELDYAWRLGSTITFSVNPELVFSTEYPDATAGCAVARHSDVQIEKTASVEKTDPGASFTYTLAVANVSDDSAADGVVVTDAIPAGLKITDVSWPGKGDATAFPSWSSCAVSGQDGSGYGGTLTCTLNGPLQPQGAEGVSAAPTITLSATVTPTSTSSSITNVAVVDYYTFGNPDDPGRDADDAIVLLSALPATGGELSPLLILLGLLALLGGTTVLVVTRRRRGEAKPTL